MLVLFLFLLPTLCYASHFRGGTISWRPVGNNTVEFKFKMGWTYGRGPGCTEKKTGQYVNETFIAGTFWNCENGSGTQTAIGTSFYYCTAADKIENWEQGENSFEYTFNDTGPYYISYTGAMWMTFSVNYSEYRGQWNLQTIVNLEQRSDTGNPNSSPIIASKPSYTLPFNCENEIQLPMVDPDGDTVRCRWAIGKECDSICKGLPAATLEEENCTLTFIADETHFIDDGWYAVALTVEDFPETPITIGSTSYSKTTPLTQVPLQFIIHIVNKSSDCGGKPMFIDPTPAKGSHISIASGESIQTKIYASNLQNPTANVTALSLTSPKGMSHNGPFPDPSRKGVVYWILQWTPTQSQIGDNIVCCMAEDSRGQVSDYYCFTFIAWDKDPCVCSPCQYNDSCVRRGSTQNYDCITPTSSTIIGNSTKVCPKGLFRCNSGQCVDANAQCNGVQQCSDGTDEHNCGVTVTLQTNSSERNTSSIEVGRNNSSGWFKPVVIVVSIVVFLCTCMCLLIFCFIYRYKRGDRNKNFPGNKVQPTPDEHLIKKEHVTEIS